MDERRWELQFSLYHWINEKAMASHSSTLAWRIPWTEEPGRLQPVGSLGVGHDWATSLSLSLSCIGEGNGSPLQCSCLENPRDGGAWWAAIYGVTKNRTQLKRLSSSRSSPFFMALGQVQSSLLLYVRNQNSIAKQFKLKKNRKKEKRIKFYKREINEKHFKKLVFSMTIV